MEEICSERVHKLKLDIVKERKKEVGTLSQKSWTRRQRRSVVAEWRSGDEEKRAEGQGNCGEALQEATVIISLQSSRSELRPRLYVTMQHCCYASLSGLTLFYTRL